MTRILIHNDKTDDMAARLADLMPEVQIATCESYEDLPDLIRDFKPDAAYSICFNGRAGFPRDALLGTDGPKWISVGGSGVDHLAGWDPEAVTVTNSAGVAAPAMAEYAFGSILHFTLDIPGLLADQEEREWRASRMMSPLRGKTMLIVGPWSYRSGGGRPRQGVWPACHRHPCAAPSRWIMLMRFTPAISCIRFGPMPISSFCRSRSCPRPVTWWTRGALRR